MFKAMSCRFFSRGISAIKASLDRGRPFFSAKKRCKPRPPFLMTVFQFVCPEPVLANARVPLRLKKGLAQKQTPLVEEAFSVQFLPHRQGLRSKNSRRTQG
jgi:hypothetical protein